MGRHGGWYRALTTGVVLAATVPSCVVDPGYEPPIECPPELVACERECVDVLTDFDHCGACGASCGADALCVGGECVCGGGLWSCEAGCVDVATDPDNCGECGMVCEADEVCSGGRCRSSCQNYQTECDGACVDLTSNSSHCGDCAKSCRSERSCSGGNCVCRAGTQNCDGVCADFTSDPDHCGACGARCDAGEVCSGGRCHCPGGTSACDGGCADLFSDRENCGACGTVCDADEVCSAGRCQADCDRSLTRCEKSCFDLDSSEAHCGKCGVACSSDEICIGGTCSCPPGRERCGDTCVDLTSDPEHCGSCGLPCAADQTCNAGQCECPNGGVLCGTSCVDTDSDPAHCGGCNQQCSTDEVCSGGRCRASCSDGEVSCDESCVDLETNQQHCGECSNACDPSLTCIDGNCECPGETTRCDGACVDTRSSTSHCGGCGQACADDETCILGQCEGKSECSDECPHGSGITWGCRRRFMYGVNYGWEHYAGDFGGISSWNEPGVSQDEDAIDARLSDMAAQGVDVVRWWVWPDFRSDGVEFDESDTPIGLGSTAIADLEKALELADAHDLHLMLTLFSFDNFRPSRVAQNIRIRGMKPIATDARRRASLVDRVIRPFARAAQQSAYRDRLIAWDVINEPEFAMSGPSKYCRDDAMPAQGGLDHVTHAQMEVFVSDVIRGLRAESSALVTVGGAGTLWACAWKYVDIDFYQFHIYDWIDEWAPYDRPPADYGIADKPAMMGEFPLGGLYRASYAELVDYWYENGWAGSLAWAVTDRGFNWSEQKVAVGSFYDEHSCGTHY